MSKSMQYLWLMLFAMLCGRAVAAAAKPAADACVAAVPDTPPLQLTAADGRSQWWRFANDAGVLRWWPQNTAAADGGFTSNSTSHHPAPTRVLTVRSQDSAASLRWLSLAGAAPQRESALLLGWFDPVHFRQQIAIARGMVPPVLLWQSSAYPASEPEVAPAAPTFAFYRRDGQLIPVVLHNADPNSHHRLQLQHALTAEPVASWSLPPTPVNTGPEQRLQLGKLIAAPVTLDKNLDGSLDRIYLLDQSGQLVRVDVSDEGQASVTLVADLSDSQWQFSFNMQASRALLPTNWSNTAFEPSGRSVSGSASQLVEPSTRVHANDESKVNPVMPSLSQALPQTGDVLVLRAKQQQHYQLLVLTLPDHLSALPVRWRALRHVTALTPSATLAQAAVTDSEPATSTASADERDRSQHRLGWWTSLPGQPINEPMLIAGVIYQPLSVPVASCQMQPMMSQMLALHLYQGSAVYGPSLLALPATAETWFEPVLLSDERLGLAAVADGPVVLEGLRGINKTCATCTEMLSGQQFPVWHRLSSFQHEQGAY